jgi:hypothetical protein
MVSVWESGWITLRKGEKGCYGFTTTDRRAHDILLVPLSTRGPHDLKVLGEKIRRKSGTGITGYFKYVVNENKDEIDYQIFKVKAVRLED